ncbi:MFS transporter [Actinosynnema sp. NPDC047251]|uniref:Permease, MFS-type n=1 Tax=Saccharothrix espanaensis (strain ATCC 51144 / DSM 44229 / JCM 9112 / NBRC 15066 / NRRL 15764) TaxID=1179773 RepID=K0K1V5_SACES|nr:MFS transporter [Saccharothrix espanaensis]CCH30844.1 Permease, MFS-type [Saccharothrix espanaensis DSM 44229]
MSFLKDIIPPPGIVRLLAVSNLAKTCAHGVLMSISVLYFTRVVAIPAERVGLALTLGAAIGVLSSVPAGRLADVRGPRPVTVTLMVALGVAACGYALVDGFFGLVAATAVVLGIESAAHAARGSLLAGLLPSAERARALAFMRATANVGVSLGAVAGGLGLLMDTKAGYIGLILAAGALFVVSGLAFLRVPSVPAAPKAAAGPKLPVLRDRAFAAVSLVNAVLVMSDALLVVAMPIWISEHTSAPPAFFTVMLLVNTAAVILLQVRVSKGADDVPGGTKAWWRSGIVLAGCCVLFAVSEGQAVWLACAALLAGTLVHVLGEMLHSAGAWSLSYGLAPEHAHGQYQGLFEMSTKLGTTVAPLAITLVLVGLGGWGWVVCAAVFLAAGQAALPVVRWAERTRAEPVLETSNSES